MTLKLLALTTALFESIPLRGLCQEREAITVKSHLWREDIAGVRH